MTATRHQRRHNRRLVIAQPQLDRASRDFQITLKRREAQVQNKDLGLSQFWNVGRSYNGITLRCYRRRCEFDSHLTSQFEVVLGVDAGRWGGDNG